MPKIHKKKIRNLLRKYSRCYADAKRTKCIRRSKSGDGEGAVVNVVCSADAMICDDGDDVDGIEEDENEAIDSKTIAPIQPDTSLTALLPLQPQAKITPQPNFKYTIKPLLILDLNGVLCTRIRSSSYQPSVQQQVKPEANVDGIEGIVNNEVKVIATTPIHPLRNLTQLLQFLSKHFCLAIWSSAQKSTTSEISEYLLQDCMDVKEGLLFIWSQSDCQVQKNTTKPSRSDKKESDHPEIYLKPLSKVYLAYPLWNASSTLLLDDSPSKAMKDVENHVVVINGLNDGRENGAIKGYFERLVEWFNVGNGDGKEQKDVREFVKANKFVRQG